MWNTQHWFHCPFRSSQINSCACDFRTSWQGPVREKGKACHCRESTYFVVKCTSYSSSGDAPTRLQDLTKRACARGLVSLEEELGSCHYVSANILGTYQVLYVTSELIGNVRTLSIIPVSIESSRPTDTCIFKIPKSSQN